MNKYGIIQDGLDKYRKVDGSLTEEGNRMFCERVKKYLDNKEEDKDKINNLQSKIDKAIEYINKLDSETTDMYEICETCKIELLDTLKEDK